jgi:hypothetical protein
MDVEHDDCVAFLLGCSDAKTLQDVEEVTLRNFKVDYGSLATEHEEGHSLSLPCTVPIVQEMEPHSNEFATWKPMNENGIHFWKMTLYHPCRIRQRGEAIRVSQF